MKELTISQACEQAADLILRDGFRAGGEGWRGHFGWCIEGALGHVYGFTAYGPIGDKVLTVLVNQSPAGRAIKQYLGLSDDYWLCHWNDNQPGDGVIRVLKEVAAVHNLSPYEVAGQALDMMAEEALALKAAMDAASSSVEPASFVEVGEAKPITNLVYCSDGMKMYVSNGEKMLPVEAMSSA